MVSNQAEYSKLEKRFVIKVLGAEKCKSCEIYRRMCDVYEEARFCRKIFINGLNIGLPQQVLVKNTVH